jgi:hypothetical protein
MARLPEAGDPPVTPRCWLCGRLLGRKIEWHHPTPKSRGGRITVPAHPICHCAIHASFSNTELDQLERKGLAPAAQPGLERFMRWIAGKHPDFNAPTRTRRRRSTDRHSTGDCCGWSKRSACEAAFAERMRDVKV